MSLTPVIVGWSLYLPGVDLATALPELAAACPDRAAEPAYPPEDAARLLGRKGLLNKEPATRLALCAVHRALGRADGAPRDAGPADPRVAVVASSNLGNLATVVEVVRAVRAGGRGEVSPLAAPNVSSNVLASAVAIWFRFSGPNLMVCSGATAGLDALALGTLLLRSGRADRVVVVGAEPVDEVVAALAMGGGAPARPAAGAACVVLGPDRGQDGEPGLGPVRACAEPPPMDPGLLWIGAATDADPDVIDLAARCGDLYGALGVVQAAVAAALVRARQRPALVVCGDAVDGWRAVDLRPGPARLDGRLAFADSSAGCCPAGH
jgi:3-oxoacyl-[acyl-carrier-protein] synthase II